MIGIRDRKAVTKLVGKLWEEGVDAEVHLRSDAESTYAEVRVLPNQSLGKVSKVVEESGFDLAFDGDTIRIYERQEGLPTETIKAQ